MKAFVVTSMTLALLGVLQRLGFLSWTGYPRTIAYSRGDDALNVLVSLCWCAWAAWVLLA